MFSFNFLSFVLIRTTWTDADFECLVRLQAIPYVDRPDIDLPRIGTADDEGNPTESVSMPFKYVKAPDGNPILPEVTTHKKYGY